MQEVSLSPEYLMTKSRYIEAAKLLIQLEKTHRNSPCDRCYDLSCLTRCSLHLGWYTQAYAFAKHQIRIMKKEKKQQSLLYVAALNQCATALCGMGKPMESKPYTLECIDLIKQLGEEQSLEYAQVFMTASHVGIKYKNWQAAFEGYERAKDILYGITFNPNTDYAETLASVLSGMAFCLQKLERKNDAYIWFQVAVTETTRIVGKEHAAYATAMHAMGAFYYHIRNPYMALHAYEKALVIYRRLFGLDHRMTTCLTDGAKCALQWLQKDKCAFCKKPRYRCEEECYNERWMLFKRDCLSCMVCREKYARLNKSYWGGLYCDKPKCKEPFE